MKENNKYLVFSSLTENEGHLLLDDLFWYNLFKDNVDFKIISSKESVSYIKENTFFSEDNLQSFKKCSFLQKINPRLFIIFKTITYKIPKSTNIIFQGFDEIAMIFFLIKNFNRKNKIYLVPTNNISLERLNRSPIFLKYLLKYLFSKSTITFHHSEFEKKLMLKVVEPKSNQFHFAALKYHLLGEKYKQISIRNLNTISYFGPSLPSKPIDNIVTLINGDLQNKYIYKFYRLSEEEEEEVKQQTNNNNNNIIFYRGYMRYNDYLASIQASTYVFLPHNALFEGKVSGILCDCIANQTPIISDKIEPVIEYFNKYGKMGKIFNYNDDLNWVETFLNDEKSDYSIFIDSMKKCSLDHTLDIIRKEFFSAINTINTR